MPPGRPHVVLRDVNKRFKGNAAVAVDGLTLDVFKGESLTLLGPSGCGKTTTLRMIAGLETPDSGMIQIGETIVSDPKNGRNDPPERRNLGMVFQSYAIWPHMTVGQNVGFPLQTRGIGRSDVRKRVDMALETVGLHGLADRPATKLSGGQQQRVAFARALVHEPEVLLLDEPLSNLDVKLREQMQIELQILQARLGWTVINVTHDQTEALGVSNRIAILNEGRIEQIGAPRELYEQPATRFVRDFLGKSVSLEGTVKHAARGRIGVTLHCEPDSVWDCKATENIPFEAGDKVELSIRPESVALRPSGTCDSHKITGRISAILYQGDRTLCEVIVSGEHILVYLTGDINPAHNDEITLYLPTQAMQIWRL